MNELAAYFLGQTADRFEVFQLIFSFLNLLMFLPCCLIMPALAGSRKIFVGPLVALFALNPVVMQNVTYTWTKAFTAFYVILGVWFYLAGWRKNDLLHMTAAFVALSAGLLVHYSAAPYLLFLTLHYLLRVFPRRALRWREVATIAAVCGLFLATWFGWSIAVYGMHTTLASNTSVTSSQRYAGSNLAKMAANVVDSIVPVFLRNDLLLKGFENQGYLGTLRDDAFVFYQHNLIFSMGLIGGPLILWLVYRVLYRCSEPSSERAFWLAMIPFCVVVGIASVGEREPLGTAHATLLPMEILGLSLLAALIPLRRALLTLFVAGCLIDFSLGIFLQVRIESLENSAQRTIFPGLTVMSGNEPNPVRPADSLSGSAWNNWILKHQYSQLVEVSRSPYVDATFGQAQMQKSLQDDELHWHGWYGRHGGTVGFLGDHAAGESGAGTTILGWLLPAFAVGFATLFTRISNTKPSKKARSFAVFWRVADPGPDVK